MISSIRNALLLFLAIAVFHTQATAKEPVGLIDFTEAELAMIVNHGPWPPRFSTDPSNRFSGMPEAIVLGEKLFFDPRLSANGRISCASCHDSLKGFTDALPTGKGTTPLTRNTTSVVNLRWNRWFGWDGANDSLWAQSVRPITLNSEMGNTRQKVAQLLREESDYACRIKKLGVDNPVVLEDEALFIIAGKVIAAYMETLVTEKSEFDHFREAFEKGNLKAAAQYPLSAQRGLKIFVGQGRCSLCHFGPLFSNGEFEDIGISYFIPGGIDKGRYGGIQSLKKNPYNLLGPFNDDPGRKTAAKTRFVTLQHRNWGEFRVPSLRNIMLTAPYTHNGSLSTLEDVVRHYSDLNLERLHSDGGSLLKPLNLNEQSIQDLVAFLRTLTAPLSPSPYAEPQTRCVMTDLR
ncbi:MAG: hypothetical protein HQM13_06530 [SAR324 cluster bacterium]|nr:hypothetical protein [SAR324 cluster bacterium]